VVSSDPQSGLAQSHKSSHSPNVDNSSSGNYLAHCSLTDIDRSIRVIIRLIMAPRTRPRARSPNPSSASASASTNDRHRAESRSEAATEESSPESMNDSRDVRSDGMSSAAFTSGDESDFSPSSPSGQRPSRPNRYRVNPRRRRFKLLRSFTMADFVTLGNAACGSLSIFSCLNYLENNKFEPYLHFAFLLLPLALFFDIFDGYVARFRQNASPYGSDLDSLADVISFAVAPAVLAFTLGMRGAWDCAILAFFVCCGVSRLARYNVTAETLADAATGKVKYYQGFPVPTSLLLVVMLGVCYVNGLVGDQLLLGSYKWSFPSHLPGTWHPLSLTFLFFGCAMLSEWKIPKP